MKIKSVLCVLLLLVNAFHASCPTRQTHITVSITETITDPLDLVEAIQTPPANRTAIQHALVQARIDETAAKVITNNDLKQGIQQTFWFLLASYDNAKAQRNDDAIDGFERLSNIDFSVSQFPDR